MPEFGLAVWQPDFQKPIIGRLRYATTFFAVIDVLAIIPAFFSGLSVDLRFLRLFRVIKLIRHSTAMQTLFRVVKSTKDQMVWTITLVAFLITLASALMYFVETSAQPNSFSSIPAAMWWAVATLTTVGYGDIYPVTVLGKLIASIISILGIGLFALPTGILGAAFLNDSEKQTSTKQECQHCGKEPW